MGKKKKKVYVLEVLCIVICRNFLSLHLEREESLEETEFDVRFTSLGEGYDLIVIPFRGSTALWDTRVS